MMKQLVGEHGWAVLDAGAVRDGAAGGGTWFAGTCVLVFEGARYMMGRMSGGASCNVWQYLKA
jgi:hypothetical protein